MSVHQVSLLDDAPLVMAPGLSVGVALRRAREGLGLSLADIARRTRITLDHLRAIEADDLSSFRKPIYAVGFARNYARAVGVPEQWVMDRVTAEYAPPAPLMTPELLSARVEPVRRTGPRGRRSNQPAVIALLALAIIACATIVAMRLLPIGEMLG